MRGLGSLSKQTHVKNLSSGANPHIVLLQETRLNVMDRKMVKSIWSSRGTGWIALDAVHLAEEVLVMRKENNVEVMESAVGLFSISIACKFNGNIVGWVSGVYGPCRCSKRKRFW